MVSLVPAEPAELFVEYGPEPGRLTERTPARTVAPDTLALFTLTGLRPGQRYAYRVRCRNASSGEDFGTRPVRHARTLRSPGAVFRFGFSTDSHIYKGHVRAHCARELSRAPVTAFQRSLENMQREDLDFLVVGGDEVVTHSGVMRPCEVDGEDAGRGTVRTARQAELRYRVMRRYYEQVTHSLPFFYTLGNHEGEAGFGDPEGRCRHFDTTLAYSLAARLKYLPNPSLVYSGGEEGNYFAFESGDALFVILDVMRYTTVYPDSPDDWTLGAEQLRWLEETLSRSIRPWKFLFIHHLVGGIGLGKCYQYGQGSLRATHNDRIDGVFRGEQARVHALMKQYGAQILFHGHDHLFIAGEKRDENGRPEGIHYVVGGHLNLLDAGERERYPALGRTYDYDDDGEPDWLMEPGFVKVTVDGPRAVRIQYLGTDIDDPEENGKVLYDQVHTR